MPAIAPFSETRLRQIICERFPAVPVPTVPEVRLHLAGPKSGLWRLAERDPAFGTPYWAHLWGGGLALARHVLDRPGLLTGRRVLDLGAGSGLVAIAAAMAGASGVIAADVDPYAMIAASLNAAENNVAIETRLGDLTAGPLPAVDLILVGDLFYEDALARRVTVFLDHCLAAGIECLIGDPRRAYLPEARLVQVADYPGPDFGDRGGRNAVFAFMPSVPDEI